MRRAHGAPGAAALKMARERIDKRMVQAGLAPTRVRAQALLMEGRVSVEGRRVDKPGTLVAEEARIEVAGPARPFASRAGAKLAAALEAFGLDVSGATALDVGAGTGGFTDCLLKRGAARVFAVDVGRGQIDQALREDPRVTLLEGVNARYLSPGDLPEPVDLAVMDVSFISAALILPRLIPLLRGADVLVLVKPQFEVGRALVGRGGIVREPSSWRKAIESVIEGAAACGLSPAGLIASPIRGASGNVEFLLHLVRAGGASPVDPVRTGALIERALRAVAGPSTTGEAT
jgi:23S rRNA (cytidine1920-2'-O)/16S rRNA (cytidine1409-2'-O)-methyltransferase